MPTIFTHPAIAIGLTPWFRSARKSKTVITAGILLSVLPDLDVLAFRFGIPYADLFGHRGFTHSLFFAGLVSLLTAWAIARWQSTKFPSTWLFLFLCTASHGVLDMLTNGGYGIALLSPFSNERYFLPFNPIEVSTLNLERFFEGQGVPVILSELKWIWLPCLVLFLGRLLLLKRPPFNADAKDAGGISEGK